jgi:hypothetical protein
MFSKKRFHSMTGSAATAPPLRVARGCAAAPLVVGSAAARAADNKAPSANVLTARFMTVLLFWVSLQCRRVRTRADIYYET